MSHEKSGAAAVFAWRHPRPHGAEGLCVGARTDLPVHPRRAKRLARRILRFARQQGLPRVVVTSPLQRCTAVGRWLRRWGWRHRIDETLRELDFGAWDGRPWSAIAKTEVDAWCANFVDHRPGDGEALASLLSRAAAWQPDGVRVIVTHGGWLLARRWAEAHPEGQLPQAAEWAAPPRYGECWTLSPLGRAASASAAAA